MVIKLRIWCRKCNGFSWKNANVEVEKSSFVLIFNMCKQGRCFFPWWRRYTHIIGYLPKYYWMLCLLLLLHWPFIQWCFTTSFFSCVFQDESLFFFKATASRFPPSFSDAAWGEFTIWHFAFLPFSESLVSVSSDGPLQKTERKSIVGCLAGR